MSVYEFLSVDIDTDIDAQTLISTSYRVAKTLVLDHRTRYHGSHPGGGKCDRLLEKRILCVSPRAGPAQPAALNGHYILYTTCV